LWVAADYEEVLMSFLIEVLRRPSQKPSSDANALVIWQDNESADEPVLVLVLASTNADKRNRFTVVECCEVFI